MLFLGIHFSANAQEDGPPPAIAPGLEISRTDLIKAITHIDSSLIFKKGPDLKGVSYYSATNTTQTEVRLVGSESELKSVEWSLIYDKDPKVTRTKIDHVSDFMVIMGRAKGTKWLDKQLTIICKNLLKNFVSDKEMLDFNRKAQIIYKAKEQMVTLIFVEW